MENLSILVQFIVAFSVLYIWTFRYKVIVADFEEFRLSEQTRVMVGTAKIALATLMLVGIWCPQLRIASSAGMGFMMMAAQFFHFRIKNPISKRIPSAIFIGLCVFIISIG